MAECENSDWRVDLSNSPLRLKYYVHNWPLPIGALQDQ